MKIVKNKVIFTTALAICVIAGTLATGYILYQDKNTDKPIRDAIEQTPVSDVVVNINPQKEQEKAYEEIVDTETGKTVIAEVQENEPIREKASEPPDPPKAKGSYTDPQTPPSYTSEQTTVEEQQKSAEKPNNEKENNKSSKSGKVYIDGFGYVDAGGSAKMETVTSDGDINKMVGVMD